MPQLTDAVHVRTLSCDDRRPKQALPSIGAKRQRMLTEAEGVEWISFIDDDDLVPVDFCSRVLAVIEGKEPPDVIGFRLRYYVDGKLQGFAVHSYRAPEIPPPPDAAEWWERHDRQPNHLNPVRRTLALKAGGYRNLNFGEDGDFSRRLAKLSPRPREVFIDADMYEYWYVPSKKYELK